MTETASHAELFSKIPEFEISPADFQRIILPFPLTLGGNYLTEDEIAKIKSSDEYQGWIVYHPEIPQEFHKGKDFSLVVYANPRTRAFFDQVTNREKIIDYLTARRAHLHLLRIASAGQQPAVENFLLGYLNYLNYLAQFKNRTEVDLLLTKKLPASIGGSAGYQFWSVAPYIYDRLRQAGLSNTKAIEAVFDWAEARETNIKSSLEDCYYPGMKKLVREHRELNEMSLSRNENDSSHSLARKIGYHIADFITDAYSMESSPPSIISQAAGNFVLLSEKESELLRRKVKIKYPGRERLDIDGITLRLFIRNSGSLDFEIKVIEREDDRVMLIANDVDQDLSPQILDFLNNHPLEILELG